jgi:hypothetical protein
MNVIRFPGRKERDEAKRQHNTSSVAPRSRTQNPSKDEILMLRFADKMDQMVLDTILDHGLSAVEVSALVTHRLAHLIQAIPALPECQDVDVEILTNYLCDLLRREALDPEARLRRPS